MSLRVPMVAVIVCNKLGLHLPVLLMLLLAETSQFYVQQRLTHLALSATLHLSLGWLVLHCKVQPHLPFLLCLGSVCWLLLCARKHGVNCLHRFI